MRSLLRTTFRSFARSPLLAAVLLGTQPDAAFAQDAPPKPNPAVVSVELMGKNSQVGSGLVLSDTGLILTSFSLASSGERAQVTFLDGSKHDVAGFVAARRGKDLVILSLKKKLRDVPFLEPVRKPTEPGAKVLLHSGPRSAPFVMAATTVALVRTGDILQSGRAPSEASPLDPDGCWLFADSFVPDTGIGGAMLDAQGKLLGMMTPDLDRGDRSHSAIHAEHIARLLAGAEARSKPLSALKRYEDTPPSIVPAEIAEPVVVPATAERTQPVAAWIDGLRKRLAATEAELPTFRNREDGVRSEIKNQLAREQELLKKQGMLEQQKTSIVPEVPVQRRRIVPVETKDKNGNATVEQRAVTVVEYEFSARQRQLIAGLNKQQADNANEVAAVKIQIRLNEFRIEQSGTDRTAAERRMAALWNEMFLLTDPLEIRHADEARAALAAMSKLTDTLGASGRTLLAKAMLHLRLREFPECLAAADQADDLDKSLTLPVQALRARCAYLKGEESDAARLVAKLGRGANEDPRVLLILARYELDRGNFAPAVRQVKAAGEKGADTAEIDLMLALLYATAPHKSSGDVPRALEHAGRACQAMVWKDWRSMLALAAANAAGKNYDAAKSILDRAATAAGADYAADFAGWKASLAASEPIRFPWK